MAKILCRNCKKMVEDSWTICPGCGKPISHKSNPNNKPQSKPMAEKSQKIIPKENKKDDTSISPKPVKKRQIKTVSAPSGNEMDDIAKSIHVTKPKNKRLDFAGASSTVATATGSGKTAAKPKAAPIKETLLEDDDTLVDDIFDDAPATKASDPEPAKPAASSTKKQYPATRGLRRPHRDEDEETATTDVVEEKEEQPQNNVPLGLPQMELFNIPGAPYPVTYMEQPVGNSGAKIKIPYLVTDKGLQPWVNTPPIVDGETRPLQEAIPTPSTSESEKPDIEMPDMPDDMPDMPEEAGFDFDPTADAPDFEDGAPADEDIPTFDEPNFSTPEPEDVQMEPAKEEKKETPSLFDMPDEAEDGEQKDTKEEPPVSKAKVEPKKKKTKEEQMDDEDEEAFMKALKVTDKKAEKEEKKKNLKAILGKKPDQQEELEAEESSADTNDDEDTETSFDGFNPNEDHYYDDTKPTFQTEKDHITIDFILRVVGAFALVIFVAIALIYMV